MTTANKILEAREHRAKLINSFTKNNQLIVSIKANIPGHHKSSYLAYLIINSFNLKQLNLKIKKVNYKESNDGPYYLIEIDTKDSNKTKQQMIAFEENFPLGRFLDIDVYFHSGALSRETKRKCFICDNYAHQCIRNKRHSVKEVYDFIESKTLDYYKEILLTYIGESIDLELNLDPKFGLVTKLSQGAHEDMDYQLMVNAKDVILPYFFEIFYEVVRSHDSLPLILNKVRKIGLDAENIMYKATKGINAYKGLIFHLGLIVLAYGYMISRKTKKKFSEIIKESARLFFKTKVKDYTFGDYAYRTYQISGARGEAINGYIHVKNALKYLEDFSNESLMKALIYLITDVEDTNLLKRAKNLEFYQEIKQRFNDLEFDDKEIKKLTSYCIEHNLSFGGSADLLIVAIFIKKLMVNSDKINL